MNSNSPDFGDVKKEDKSNGKKVLAEMPRITTTDEKSSLKLLRGGDETSTSATIEKDKQVSSDIQSRMII